MYILFTDIHYKLIGYTYLVSCWHCGICRIETSSRDVTISIIAAHVAAVIVAKEENSSQDVC